jgi:hypothetical protein
LPDADSFGALEFLAERFEFLCHVPLGDRAFTQGAAADVVLHRPAQHLLLEGRVTLGALDSAALRLRGEEEFRGDGSGQKGRERGLRCGPKGLALKLR